MKATVRKLGEMVACVAVAFTLAVTLAPALPQANAAEAQAETATESETATSSEATGEEAATTTQERTAVDAGLEKQGESLDSPSSEEEPAEPTAEPVIQLTADGFPILRTTSQLKNGAALALETDGIVVISVTTPVYVTFGAENAYDIEADAPLDTFTATAPVTFQNTGTAYARMAGITCTDEGAQNLLTKTDGTTPIDETNQIFKLSNGTDTPVSFGPVAGTSNANTVGASDLGTSFDIPDRSDATTSGAKTFTYTLDLTNTQVNTSAVDEMEVGGSVSMELASVVYTFEAATTTITWNAGEGVFKSTNENTLVETPNYATSATVTLPTEAPERDGYTFLGWFTEATGGTQVVGGETPLPTVPTTYYAHWETASFTVTFDANGGTFRDSKTSQAFTLTKGAAITAPTPSQAPSEGEGFVGWYAATDETQAIVDFSTTTVTGNITYKAKWAQLQAYAVYGTDTAGVKTMVFLKSATEPTTNSKVTYTNDTDQSVEITVANVYTGIETADYSESYKAPWTYTDLENYTNDVQTVVFRDRIAPVSTACWFYQMDTLTSIVHFDNLDTANVTNMKYMFSGCSSLASLDLSGFNTANVTTMHSMFSGCSGLTTLDVSGFNTANVTDMSYMFCYYSSPTLDLSGFDTANVTNMSNMFYGCSGLTSLDVSSFDTTNVTNMSTMFAVCSSLTSLDVSRKEIENSDGTSYTTWNTSNVTDMSCMFWRCSSPTLDLSDFDTTNVTDMSCMFWNSSSLTSLDVSRKEIENSDGTSYTTWNTSNVTTMHSMFSGCSGLSTLDVSGFNTAKVTEMTGMFYNCNRLAAIFVGDGWSTAAVDFSQTMFKDCSKLVGSKGTTYNSSYTDKTYARIDYKNQAGDGTDNVPGYLSYKTVYTVTFDPAGGTFSDGETTSTDAKTVKLYPWETVSAPTETLTRDGYVLDGWYKDGDTTEAIVDFAVKGGVSVSSDTTYKAKWAQPQAYAVYGTDSKSNGALVFLKSATVPTASSTYTFTNAAGTDTTITVAEVYTGIETTTYSSYSDVPWYSNRTNIQTVAFNDTITPASTAYWFYEMNNLTAIAQIDHLDTANVTNMSYMFDGCSGLTSLNLSSFNTASVKNMSHMFNGCSGLTSLDLSSFNTANVTTMNCMFYGCSSLTSLDLNSFNTANVTNMGVLFGDCSNLGSLDLSSFNTAKVTTMARMFAGCSGLASLNVSSFNTAKVTSMHSMFYDCSSLTSLDVSHFGTVNVTSMAFMFYRCSSLDSLDVAGFDTAEVTSMHSMFYNCSSLVTIYAGDSWDTSAVTTSVYMFSACRNLVGGNGTAYNASYVDATYARIDQEGQPGYFTEKPAVTNSILRATLVLT